jgi:hypothetical protein
MCATTQDAYTRKAEELNFQVVFVSADKKEAAFNEYLTEMPWLALPYEDRERQVGVVTGSRGGGGNHR